MEEVRFLKENLKKRQDDDVVVCGWCGCGVVVGVREEEDGGADEFC